VFLTTGKFLEKWSGNLPVVKTTMQPKATESLHEMVWKLTSGKKTTLPTATESLHEMVWKLTSG
jgi:hypothetical protein